MKMFLCNRACGQKLCMVALFIVIGIFLSLSLLAHSSGWRKLPTCSVLNVILLISPRHFCAVRSVCHILVLSY